MISTKENLKIKLFTEHKSGSKSLPKMTVKEIAEKISDLFNGFLDGIEVALLEEDYEVTDKIFDLIGELKKYDG